jgi:hypothetical protein
MIMLERHSSPDFQKYSRLITLGGVLSVTSLLALRLGLPKAIVAALATTAIGIAMSVALRVLLRFTR